VSHNVVALPLQFFKVVVGGGGALLLWACVPLEIFTQESDMMS
jgi:hypothetical protein